jgi:elongation factor G
MGHRSHLNWRNLAVCGHAAAGKTTLTNRLLATAVVPGDPSLPPNFSCDFEPEEKAHGYSVDSALVHWQRSGLHFNVLDTPGYFDFIGALIGAMAVVDAAVLCVSGRDGVQVSSRRAMQEAEKAHIPTFIVITKMDDPQADFTAVLEQCRATWGAMVVPIEIPIGSGDSFTRTVSALEPPDGNSDYSGAVVDWNETHQMLVEKLVETDETLMSQYFEGIKPDHQTLSRLLHDAILTRQVIPVLCVSALKGIGLELLLDVLAELAPEPGEITRYADTEDGEHVEIDQSADAPLAAQVFKVRVDPFVGRINYVRIFGGTIRKDEQLHVGGIRKDVKVTQPMLALGDTLTPADEAAAGQIIALGKMDDLHLGSTLGPYKLTSINFPRAMVGVAITPLRHGDENKLSAALHKLAEEDPTLNLSMDSQTGEWIMSGMSELHLQLLRERMWRRDRVEIDTHDPHIPYRETITQTAEGSYRHKKQSGGRGQFGEVHCRIMPLPRGTEIESFAMKERFPQMKSHHYHPEHNFLWIDSIVGASIPGNFMPAVEKGFLECLHHGSLAGYPIQDIAVEVFFGKHHPVDSSETAFRIAASHALRDVFDRAHPALLEPIAKITITCPESSVGDIYGDMSSRGGRVLGTESSAPGMQSIECEVPLRSISHYDRTLSSVTAGQGTYSLELSHYEVVARDAAQEIIRQAKQELAGTTAS